MDVTSTFFAQIEGVIDEIYISNDGDQEWEEVGMAYFYGIMRSDTGVAERPNQHRGLFHIKRTQ